MGRWQLALFSFIVRAHLFNSDNKYFRKASISMGSWQLDGLSTDEDAVGLKK